MRISMILLTLLATTASAGNPVGWNLYLIDRWGGRHLQTFTDSEYAGTPVAFVSEEGCIGQGIAIMTAGGSKYVGFYCKRGK